jgi:N-acyl-phosphatidylethanolamine-hydrolysing phospholipase D
MPTKPHHTATGFRNNYIESVTKSLGDVLRWQWRRIRDHLPPKPTLPTPQVGADLDFIRRNAAAAAAMHPAVTWIGHATMLVQASGLNVLTDPVFCARVSPVQFAGPARAQPPGIDVRRGSRGLASPERSNSIGGTPMFMPASNSASPRRSTGPAAP